MSDVSRTQVVARRLRQASRRVYHALTTPTIVDSDLPPLPGDVADADALRELLSDTDLFANPEEADGYLSDAFDRFRITMALVPELAKGASVLELGANPYFITTLLERRGLNVRCANWFGDDSGFGDKGVQVVTGPKSGERRVYEFDHFNIERHRFPYDDQTFDLVLCCEILEHLPNDPTHLLAETHRVLKQPDGVLLLTTPNAVRLDNLLRMQRGENVYEELSGHGTYGRHNREYTVDELNLLLHELGYRVHRVVAADIHEHIPPGPLSADVRTSDRGDNLFALARADGEPRWRYPRWLYSAPWGYRRVVRPDVRMGYNDDVQSSGFHLLEVVAGREIRWTGAADAATATLPRPGGAARVVVEGLRPPPEVGDEVELILRSGSERVAWTLPCDGSPFRVEAAIDPTGLESDSGSDSGTADEVVALRLVVEPTWRPADVGIGGDTRRLGVAVSRVAFED